MISTSKRLNTKTALKYKLSGSDTSKNFFPDSFIPTYLNQMISLSQCVEITKLSLTPMNQNNKQSKLGLLQLRFLRCIVAVFVTLCNFSTNFHVSRLKKTKPGLSFLNSSEKQQLSMSSWIESFRQLKNLRKSMLLLLIEETTIRQKWRHINKSLTKKLRNCSKKKMKTKQKFECKSTK